MMETSLPTSNNSPEPPSLVSHGVTNDEDSQESMTLQNALLPLPDTQCDSPEQDHSSPLERDGTLQLLSRPQNLDIDPGESFSWGKPVKITPGQFSRPAPAKSMVDAMKKDPATSFPGGMSSMNVISTDSFARASVQSNAVAFGQSGHATSPPRHRANGESSHAPLLGVKGSLACGETHQPVENDPEHLNRIQSSPRRPPFEDYQPRYRRLGVVDQVPVPHTSSVGQSARPEDLGVVDLGVAEKRTGCAPQVSGDISPQGQTSSEQDKREYHSVNQPANAAQKNEPRHRISLPNDTSVSSPAQMPQSLPQEDRQHQPFHEGLAHRNRPGAPPHPTLERPMRDVRRVSSTKTPTHCPPSRSSVYGSNISKKRSQTRPSVSSRTRPSRQRTSRYHDDTPSTKRWDPRTPASNRSLSRGSSQRSKESHEVDMFAGSLAQVLNINLGMLKEAWKKKDQERAYLERHLQKQEGTLSNFERQSEGKSMRIQELELDRGRLQEQVESVNQQLEDRSTRLSKLEEKCRTYKEHLNLATAEQQDLYTAAKAKCENAINQMREEERKRAVLGEQERKEVQATRERLTQIVKSTVTECSFKERECESWL